MAKKTATAVTIAITMLLSCTGNRANKQDDSAAPGGARVAATMGGEMLLLVGTYTSRGGSEGVYLYRFDTDTGKGDSLGMAKADNPSYLTVSPDERFVYTVSEGGKGSSAVHAFSLDKQQGRMELLNSLPTNSEGPCYITIDGKGRNLHTANYGGGSISSFRVNEDGSLAPGTSVMLFSGAGPDSTRQQSPHLHSVRYTPDGQFLFAADLGTDKLYRFTANDTPFEGQPPIHESSLREWSTPAETGPRHFDFHPDGKFLYLLGELSGEVIVYDYHYGELQQKQVIAADTLGARGSADIRVSPDGRFLYASNRLQADGIAIFSIDSEEGTLTRVGYQLTAKHPRNFEITPNGNFLLVAGRDDDKVQVFRVDKETGLLTDTHQDIPVSKPVCLKFAGAEW
ncbi:MAG: lactonase family protein [Proteiniphilum sp.]